MYIKAVILKIYDHKQATVSLLVMLRQVIQAIFVTINSVILKQQRNGETNVNISRHDTGSLKFVLFTSSRLSNV